MPLLNGERFIKKVPPPNLSPDEEVFFSPITYEIFRDYDDFFERTILLNSVAWECAFCTKEQVTYPEAVACEMSDLAQLANFGDGLIRGLLHIIHNSQRHKLADLVDLLCGFVSPRFFVGEQVFIRRPGSNTSQAVRIDCVLLPSASAQEKNSSGVCALPNEPGCSNLLSTIPDSSEIKYVVKLVKSDGASNDEASIVTEGSSMIFCASALHRGPKNFISRDRIKFFIRQTCRLNQQIFVPKEAMLHHFKLHPFGPLKWADMFALPEPTWPELTPPTNLVMRQKIQRPLTGTPQQVSSTRLPSGAKGSAGKNKLVYSSHVDTVKPKVLIDLCGGDTKNSAQVKAREAMQMTWDSERLVRAERTELERVWALLRKHEDLELSDLVPLPHFTPVTTRIPFEMFGQALQLFEFLRVFGPILNLPLPGYQESTFTSLSKTSALPLGASNGTAEVCDFFLDSVCICDGIKSKLSWEILEDLLLDTNPTGGFVDLIIGLLNSIRRLEYDLGSRTISPTAEAAAISAVSAIATVEFGLPLAYAGSLTGLGSSPEYTTMLAETLQVDPVLLSIFHSTGESTRDCELVGAPPLSAVSSRADKAALALAAVEPVDQQQQQLGGGFGKSSVIRAAATAAAVGAASFPPLDRAGISEALWLHITTAPAKAGGWRGLIWGGTRPLDDPCIALHRHHKDLVEKLRIVPVWSWPLGEKLILLSTLVDEILLEPSIRDRMDERLDHLRSLRLQLRSIQSERFKLYGGSATLAATLYGFSPSALVSSCDNWLTGTPPILRAHIARGRKKAQEVKATVVAAKLAILESHGKGTTSDSSVGINVDSDSETNKADAETNTLCNSSEKENCSNEPLVSFVEELNMEESELWLTILETARNCSMIPLGLDRLYRRYWLVMSLPAILIEDTRGEMFSAPLNSSMATPSTITQSINLRVRSRQVDSTLTLGSNPIVAAEKFNSAICDLLNTPMEDVHWQNPNLLDRDSLVSQLAIDLPKNRDQLSLDQLRRLVHPERQDNTTVDTKHPVVVQVESLQRNPIPWSVFAISEISNDAAVNGSASDVAARRYEEATKAINQLEASLNARGSRESRLRKSVSQLRPILIQVVVDCPIEQLTDLNREHMTKVKSLVSNDVLYSWLECTIRGVASRLGVTELVSDALEAMTVSCENSNSKKAVDKQEAASLDDFKLENEQFDESVPSDTVPQSVGASDTCIQLDCRPEVLVANQCGSDNYVEKSCTLTRLKRMSDAVLQIAMSLGVKRLAAPLSHDDRSIRGLHPSRSAPNFLSTAWQASDSGSPIPGEFDPYDFSSSLSSVPGISYLPVHTTGWQRWCARVSSVSSTAQLHLLTRSLERAARRALRGGRGVPAAISSYAAQHPLPEIRCTACRGLADSQTPASSTSTSIPSLSVPTPPPSFVLCSTCASPFHLDCLVSSRSRQLSSSFSTHNFRPRSSTNLRSSKLALDLANLPIMQVAGAYVLLPGFLGGAPANRLETMGTCLLICDRCRRLAGYTSVEEVFATKDPPTLELEQKGVNSMLTDSNDESEGATDEAGAKVSRSSSIATGETFVQSPQPTVIKKKPAKEAKSRGRPLGSGSKSSYKRRNEIRCSGRPGKRARSTKLNAEGDFQEDDDGDNDDNDASVSEPQEIVLIDENRDDGSLTASEGCLGAESVYYDDEEDAFREQEQRQQQRKSTSKQASARDGSSSRTLTNGIGRGRGRQSSTSGGRVGRRSSAASITPEIVTDVSFSIDRNSYAAEYGLNQQTAAERFLSEISNLSVARPLVRCALSRNVAAMTGGNNDLNGHDVLALRSAASATSGGGVYRTRGTTAAEADGPSCAANLYAYDLDGLKDILTRGALPAGPGEVVSQLRLLIKHWTSSNRPGSRLHHCAQDVSAYVERRLAELREANELTHPADATVSLQ